MGYLIAPMLLGPILGPLVGGFITDASNWRFVFVALASIVIPILVCCIFLVPETHHWFVEEVLIFLDFTLLPEFMIFWDLLIFFHN